jgi:aspartyl-tRNA(Asn)/glutamyl-tRNA(Gln) amidotransferase subunit C
MPLSDEQVRHVAMLARLGLADDERERFRHQLDAILEHIDRIAQVDTSAVGETAQVGELVNAWREDAVADSLPAERALANAPKSSGEHFEVGAIQE